MDFSTPLELSRQDALLQNALYLLIKEGLGVDEVGHREPDEKEVVEFPELCPKVLKSTTLFCHVVLERLVNLLIGGNTRFSF